MTLHWNRELIEACKGGSRRAQKELYDQYKDAMYNVALRLMNNVHDAEDIMVSSFADVFTHLDSYDYKATPGAWIKRIVINNSLTELKRNKTNLVFTDNHHESVIESTPLKSECMDVSLIKKSIAELPEGYRSVLTLYLIEGYDHAEISQVMGISIATSKSQYSRAKKKLKQIIIEKNNPIPLGNG